MSDRGREPAILLGVGALLLALLGLQPHDRFTWFLEIAPILIGVPVLVATASATSPRASCPRSSPARCSSAARPSCAAAGFSFW